MILDEAIKHAQIKIVQKVLKSTSSYQKGY